MYSERYRELNGRRYRGFVTHAVSLGVVLVRVSRFSLALNSCYSITRMTLRDRGLMIERQPHQQQWLPMDYLAAWRTVNVLALDYFCTDYFRRRC